MLAVIGSEGGEFNHFLKKVSLIKLLEASLNITPTKRVDGVLPKLSRL